MDKEIGKLLKHGHIEKVDKIQDDVGVYSTNSNYRQKDKSVKLALDARALNQSIAEDKYQMPDLEFLFDTIVKKFDKKGAGFHLLT